MEYLGAASGYSSTGRIWDWGHRDIPDTFPASFSSHPASPAAPHTEGEAPRSQTCPGVDSTKVTIHADPRSLVPHTHTNVTGMLPGKKAFPKPSDHICTVLWQVPAMLLHTETPQCLHLRHSYSLVDKVMTDNRDY